MAASDLPSQHHGGAEIFYRELLHFAVEAYKQHNPNFVRFQLATRDQSWFVVGCYLALDNTLYTKRIVRAMEQCPH